MFVKDQKIRIDTDDGYRPSSNADFKLSWLDNNTVQVVQVTYGFGSNGIQKSENIKFG